MIIRKFSRNRNTNTRYRNTDTPKPTKKIKRLPKENFSDILLHCITQSIDTNHTIHLHNLSALRRGEHSHVLIYSTPSRSSLTPAPSILLARRDFPAARIVVAVAAAAVWIARGYLRLTDSLPRALAAS